MALRPICQALCSWAVAAGAGAQCAVRRSCAQCRAGAWPSRARAQALAQPSLMLPLLLRQKERLHAGAGGAGGLEAAGRSHGGGSKLRHEAGGIARA